MGETVILDGGRSYDPAGAALAWDWTQVAGPAVELTDPASPEPSFVPLEEGDYAFRLEVSNGSHWSLPDTVEVRVEGAGCFVGALVY